MDSGKRILVIDDEDHLCQLVKSRLEANGYTVIIANDGTEGLDKIAKELPDLVLLDIMMPPPDGLTVLRQIRHNADTALLPVVMLTAKGDTDTILKASEAKSTDYLIKPFDAKDLLDIIKRYVGN